MEQLIDLLYLDEPGPNGIIYPTAVVQVAVTEFEERIKNSGGILGECSIPAETQLDKEPTDRYTSIDLGRVSHIVLHMWIDKRTLKCKVKLLGKYAQITDLLPLTFEGIPRATGHIENKVCTLYSLITVDLALIDTK